MTLSIVCLAHRYDIAESIIRTLRSIGVQKNDVSVLFPDTSTTNDFSHEMHPKAPEGTASGTSAGGVLGGVLGWLVGMGTIAIPGVGPFIAAGPLFTALCGVALGAAVGGVTGSLIGLAIPEVEAKRYEGKIRDGRIPLSVTTESTDFAHDIAAVLKQAGAEDVATTTPATVARTPGTKRDARNSTTVLQVPQTPKSRSAIS